MADKLRMQQQLEALQQKYIGTGHADTTSHEFKVNMMRDYYAAILGHRPLLEYVALSQGISTERCRLQLLDKYIQPCGPPPKTKREEEDDEEDEEMGDARK